jgi:stringent starvation protein B
MSSTQNSEATSTRPYLIRALHEWCSDNGFTPYVTVAVDNSVQVPREFVKDGEIVLNIGFDATTSLRMGNDYLEFKARFGGVAREIMVPIDQVLAIFARENGQGMAFPKLARVDINSLKTKEVSLNEKSQRSSPMVVSSVLPPQSGNPSESLGEPDSSLPVPPAKRSRPSLTRIK